MKHAIASALSVAALVCLSACSGDTPARDTEPEPAHVLLGEADEAVLGAAGAEAAAEPLLAAFRALDGALGSTRGLEEIVVVQPADAEALKADDQAPRFLWRDPADASDTWYVVVPRGTAGGEELRLLVRGAMPAESVLDPLASTLHAWTPSASAWAALTGSGGRGPRHRHLRRLRRRRPGSTAHARHGHGADRGLTSGPADPSRLTVITSIVPSTAKGRRSAYLGETVEPRSAPTSTVTVAVKASEGGGEEEERGADPVRGASRRDLRERDGCVG